MFARAPSLLALAAGVLGCTLAADLDRFGPAPSGGAGGTAASGGAGGAGGWSPSGSGGGGGNGTLYRDAVLSDGPIGYWRLDETAGPIADTDVAGGPSGMYGAGCDYEVTGAIANNAAVEFDGIACVISYGEVFAFANNTAFSLEAWVRPNSFDGNLRRIFSKEHPDSNGRQGYNLIADGASISFDRWRDDAADAVDGANVLSTSAFTHVVATYDGSVMRLYVNGAPAGEVASSKAIVSLAQPFTAGAASASTNFFDGTLDELAVYGIALLPDRVLAHYEAAARR